MRSIATILLLCIYAFTTSCDMMVGENGVVQDAITGEPIEGVQVKMHSDRQGSKSDITDESGYFSTIISFSCGIASCDTDFSIVFTKEGYQSATITENYAANAEYLDEDAKDSIIVKMLPAN